jgi:hypothetical protein
MKRWWITALVLMTAPFLRAQSSAPPDVSGFTKSPTEHIIDTIEDPFRVRNVTGIISTEKSESGRADVLMEIKGPNDDQTVRRVITGKNGRFKISHVPEGNYRFKATLYGFQSVMGTIVVSKHAPQSSEIKIEMKSGV